MPIAVLLLAIAAGGWLRFANLSTRELSPDEAASWMAASASSAAEVVSRQAHLNPGELGLHDLTLHYWMRAFGEGLAAMRSLSALAGTIAVLLAFFVACEVHAIESPDANAEHGPPTESTTLIAAVAALFLAVGLVTIKYAREARMYPLALALVLAQVWFFLRALRRDHLAHRAGLAITTALAFAATFSTVLILAPEGAYLLIVAVESRRTNLRRIAQLIVSLAIGLILTIPGVLFYLHARGGAPNANTWDWIPLPPPWATVTFFNKATGTYTFPLLAILALLGIGREWRSRRPALIFLLLWALLPPILLTIASYVFRPAFVERYLLSCFVPFFILAAIGVFKLEPASFRPGAVAIVVALSLAHFAEWQGKPHGAEWDQAAQAAIAGSPAPSVIGVAPRYAADLVRYDLRDHDPPPQIVAFDATQPADLVIVGDNVPARELQALAARYPHLVAHPRGVMVRGR